MIMIRGTILAVAAVATVAASPAAAQLQQQDGEAFVKAVREEDNNKALEILQDRGKAIVNIRDSKGETALIVAVARRDRIWAGHLLKEGADPNYPARSGETPLITAARVGSLETAQLLVSVGAKVDGHNRMGETPLIVAVQQRQTPVVRYLLERGANPDKADSAAGYSARDYAKRDTRNRDLLKLIEAKKPPAGVAAKQP